MSTISSDNQGVSTLKTQEIAKDGVHFRFRDIWLLKTGYCSDAQVIAGTRNFNVHKSIVGSRSSFMAQALSREPKKGEGQVIRIRHHTLKQVELLLEFIYSGSIETIDSFSLVDCVELMMLGSHFTVHGMVEYAEKILWDKLTSILQAICTLPATAGIPHPQSAIAVTLGQLNFDEQFTNAVDKAYDSPQCAGRLVLADFVWAARHWLYGHPTIANLNNKYPAFGSHVLTTFFNGPQSSFIQADGQLTPTAKTTSGVLCTNCTRAQAERPNQTMQLFVPKSL